MRKYLPVLIGISALTFVAFAFLLHSKNASAAAASHIVISEIQVAGATPNDDFIELYNPTSVDINLGDLRLVKRTSSGAADESIVAFTAIDVIPAHGYFLWCNTALSTTLTCDKTSTDTVSNNNSVGLRNEPADTGVLVDSVTFGTVANPLGEGTSLTAPTASTSVERKANSTSTALSMAIGGLDELMGNAEDTDNNSNDFIVRSTPQPQNMASAIEPPEVSPTPSITPTVTPTMTPSLTPTLEPTATPTVAPTSTPTITPSPTNTPTPTITPTATPTSSPTPTVTPSPTITVVPTVTMTPTSTPTPNPTVIPSPTPTKSGRVIAHGPLFTCTLNFRPWIMFGKVHYFPYFSCARTSI